MSPKILTVLTVPGNRLWIPIVLVFVAGIIKYGERICAMYFASINVTKLGFYKTTHDDLEMRPRNWYYKVEADDYFEEVITWGNKIMAETNTGILYGLEPVMNFYYDKYFTKFCLSYGYLCRFVTISCLLTALGLFLFEDKQYKQGFDPFNIKVTYTLMCSAVALDIIGLFMQFFSDRVHVLFPTLTEFSFMKRILKLRSTRSSKCKKNPYTKFTQLSTLLPFRKWSQSISGFNIIRCSYYMMRKQPLSLHYFNMFSGGSIFKWLNKVKNPFILELWEFIFTEFQMVHPSRDTKMESTVFRDISISEEIKTKLIPYMKDIALDDLILMWHIATHLCYVQELNVEVDEREFSKLLSDYMMYILVLQTDIIPHAEFIDIKNILDDLQLNLKPYFINGDPDQVEACKKFVAADPDQVVQTNVPLNYSGNNVRMLAKVLGMISEESIKWEIISRVWFQLLYHAARECSFSIHVQHLSKGGELISFVWALHHMPVLVYLIKSYVLARPWWLCSLCAAHGP